MSYELIYALIEKMHIRLNELIVRCNYDLLNTEVQKYSQRLDKVLSHYNRMQDKKKQQSLNK